jgi:hypothetical protein
MAALPILKSVEGEQMAKLKKSKADARIKYQWRPRGEERCDRCTMFRAPDECTEVAGVISPRGWCKIFAARRRAR